MDDEQLSGVLDLVYESAVDPDVWPRFLERFADATHADSSALVWQDQRSRGGVAMGARLDPNTFDSYFEHFARRHPSQRWQHDPKARLRYFVPRIVADDDALPKPQLMRTDFYNQFMRPFGLHSVLRLGLAAQGEAAAFLMISRTDRKPRFEGEDLEIARRLHPHVMRAVSLANKLGLGRKGGLEAVLAASPHALLVTDGSARILHANPAAERLLASGDALSVTTGRLAALTSKSTARLQGLIATAASPPPGRPSSGAMALGSPRRKLPLPVTVTPLRADAGLALRGEPAVLVCLSDPEAQGRLSASLLHQFFDLSPAEARVAAALFDGASPREAAARLGISFYTARAHLARIYEKTGVNRQSELTRLLAAASEFQAP